jgi:hypothetical protein
VDFDAALLELGLGSMTELVGAENGEERDGVGKLGELDRRDPPSSRRLLPRLRGVDDLAGRRDMLDRDELDHLDMPDDGDAHVGHAHKNARADV